MVLERNFYSQLGLNCKFFFFNLTPFASDAVLRSRSLYFLVGAGAGVIRLLAPAAPVDKTEKILNEILFVLTLIKCEQILKNK